MNQADALREFFRWAVREATWDGVDLNGCDIQDKAVELGLLVEEIYDPAKHGDEPYQMWDIEPGQDLFVFAPGIK